MEKRFWNWETVWELLFILLTIALAVFLYATELADAKEIIPEKSIIEPIPFEEMIKHDEDVAFQKWIEKEEIIEGSKYLIEVTDEDIDLMARVVMSEGSLLCADAKQAIATTIVNRVRDNTYQFRNLNSVKEVVYHGKAYSTADNGEPDETCYAAVEAALTYEAFEPSMFWFWYGKYPTYAECEPYLEIDGMCFAIAKK